MILSALAILAGAGVPLVTSKSRSGSLLGDDRARGVAFWTLAVSGVAWGVTQSSILGGVAIGSGIAWGAMKADDLSKALP